MSNGASKNSSAALITLGSVQDIVASSFQCHSVPAVGLTMDAIDGVNSANIAMTNICNVYDVPRVSTVSN